ncbi:hypothetical protein ABZW18_21145 [Streptomyces sp. NPDC004647]|uniref:hypothetical protein n=1 Tax=Streptomyces sp. NPDC004647 TaxID=3154671 RepID=UPI00339FEE03
MTDPDAHRPEPRRAECPDCHAGPGYDNTRVMTVGTTGLTETWHLPDCPQHTVDRILLEDGARRVEEQEAWAREAFPAAHERLRAAAAGIADDPAAAPFVAALLQLVQTQADRPGRFVVLDEWARILDQHFPPPQQPDSGRGDGTTR